MSASSTERMLVAVASAGCSENSSSIRSAKELSPSPTGVSRLTGFLDQLEQAPDLHLVEARVGGDLGQRRVAVQLLRQQAAAAQHAPHLVGDVHREADRPPLVGGSARVIDSAS